MVEMYEIMRLQLHNGLLLVASIVLLCRQPLVLGANEVDWNYKDQGAWANFLSDELENLRQSPINIKEGEIREHDNLDLELVNYDQSLPASMINNGHSISTSFKEAPLEDRPFIRLNWLGKRNEYYLDELHFHWGVRASRGSEHKINGRRHHAEMHMVHIKRGLTIDDIGKEDDAAAVLGIFIELRNETSNSELANIINVASSVNNTHGEVTQNYRISKVRRLLPVNAAPLHSYLGSLTTPPCYESVTWLVFSQPIYITNIELLRLSNMFTDEGGKSHIIGNTYRKTQPAPAGPVYSTSKVTFS